MLQEIVKAVSIPVVAIGGINCSNVKYLHETGISGIAVVSAILGAAQAYSAAKKNEKGGNQHIKYKKINIAATNSYMFKVSVKSARRHI